MTIPVADSCTLPTARRPGRLAEFDRLAVRTLRRVERVEPLCLRVILAGTDATEAAARALAERESRCCGFFSFTVVRDGDDVRVDIGVPAARSDILDGLHARLSAVRGPVPRRSGVR